MDHCSTCRRPLDGALVCPDCGAYAPDIDPRGAAARSRQAEQAERADPPGLPVVTSGERAVEPGEVEPGEVQPAEVQPGEGAPAGSEPAPDALVASVGASVGAGSAGADRRRKNRRRVVAATAVALLGGGLTVAVVSAGSAGRPASASTPDAGVDTATAPPAPSPSAAARPSPSYPQGSPSRTARILPPPSGTVGEESGTRVPYASRQPSATATPGTVGPAGPTGSVPAPATGSGTPSPPTASPTTTPPQEQRFCLLKLCF
jgi:hypothetical protein